MIAANELRIGNWVNYLDINGLNPAQIEIDDFINLKEDGEKNFPFSPIPLTPEILEKCGAIVYEFDNGLGNQYRIKDRLFVIRDGDIVDYGSSVIIKHLHQLQNLYWCLTGTELNYTP